MSNPTLSDWYKHFPTYGGVVLIAAIQTAVLLFVLKPFDRPERAAHRHSA